MIDDAFEAHAIPARSCDRPIRSLICGIYFGMLTVVGLRLSKRLPSSGGAERYLETSSLDAVSAGLNAETAEVAAGNLHRHSHSYNHSRHRIRRPASVFERAVVVRHFLYRRHKTSPN
jgi:hypothetical protein